MDFDRIRVLYPDTFGFTRGKYVPAQANHGAVNFSLTIFGVGYDRALVPAPGAGVNDGMGDLTAVYDPAALRPWWQPGVGVTIADLVRNGKPFPLSPRHALQRAVGAWQELGYAPKIGLELEAYVLQPDGDGGWVPWDTPSALCYGVGLLVDPVGLIDEILAAALHCGIPIETAGSEYDSPQFELTVRYDDALTAVDNTFLLKQICREIAVKHELMMTFLGRPLRDRGGNGLHVNLSLAGEDGGNAMADPTAEGGLSVLTRRCIAGLIAHHEGMSAICAPTVNAYKRLQPGQLSGYWANWGYDHRSVTVRIPSDRGDGTRIEHRMPDGAANPYLATAAVLHAARLGVVGGLEAPDPERGDALATANTERCVPENLSLALDAFEQDGALVEAMGPDLAAHFVAMKREEWRRFSRHVTDWELSEYLMYH